MTCWLVWCRARYGLEGHFWGFAAGSALPGKEQAGVGFGNVVLGTNPENASGLINPARRPLDLAEVSDRSFVHDYMAFAVAPLGAKLLIAERRQEAEGF